jgi:hypothetical protein
MGRAGSVLKGNIKTRRSRQQGYGQQAHKAVADYNIGKSIEIWRFATGKSALSGSLFGHDEKNSLFVICVCKRAQSSH